jgi:glycosyltransferase involved in cell wall biosynthesis
MKIAIDAILLLSPLTGVGNYAYQIAKALQSIDPVNEYTYFYGFYSSNLISPEERPDNFSRLKETVRKIPFLGTLAKNLRDVANYFSSRTFDLYFEPHFIPLRIPAKHTVVTVPDFSFSRFPEWHSQDKVRYFQKHFWKKIDQAERIILISDFIREEASQLFRFPADRLTTIHLGFDPDIFRVYPPQDLLPVRRKYHLPENFMLFVGSIEPRKNLRSLLRAYMELEEPVRKEFKIVLVGFEGWKNEEIMSLLGKLEPDVLYLGYVPDNELGKFYNLASLFVYPSFYEGFCLPPLEAMACGCPVIVSNAASLPEVCGEAAFYVDPNDIGSIARGMDRVLKDETLRKSMIAKGLERSRLFSWEKSAREHLKVFEEVMNG